MKTIYLHIGTHKTGSTSLQFFLHRAASALGREGVLYPIAGRSESTPWGHHQLSGEIGLDPDGLHGGAWDTLKEEVNDWKGEAILLSSEDFSLWTAQQIDRLRHVFAGHRVEVIVYLRRPFDFIRSSYKQHLMSKGTDSMADFLSGHTDRFDYLSLLRRWESAPFVDVVHPRLYDKAKKGPGIERDFMKCLECCDRDVFHLIRGRVHVSPSNSLMQTIRAVNRMEVVAARRFRGKRLTGGLGRRARRSVYRKQRFGRLIKYAVHATSLKGESIEKALFREWEGLESRFIRNHQAFLDRYIQEKDRKYLEW